ncbi:MAG: hypothetical protein EHM91_01780 [Planctomycetota bacterium]|nr:MAG: hypothetical protein EHM91_01780 [Planctomycetota bacterium]
MNALTLAVFVLVAQDQAKVDLAIKKGGEYLRKGISPESHQSCEHPFADSDELILWTYVHAGVPEEGPEIQALLQKMLGAELQKTYKVALQAMILEELDRVKHQHRIAECAQFLVDNQLKNGQWSYGDPTPFLKDVPTTGTPRKDVATSGKKAAKPVPGVRTKPVVKTRIVVTKRRDGWGENGAAEGDNSNSQYAALGLRACHDAGIVIPPEVAQMGLKAWEKTQRDGGWSYQLSKKQGYGSMTAGALGSMVIFHYILNEPWMKDTAIQNGLKWMADHFTVQENPDHANGPKHAASTHYFLYAMERAGILYGTETFGPHAWYSEGARWLLETQKGDGSWATSGAKGSTAVWDTCFAILFLRRATRPLTDVASEVRVRR